MRGGHILSAEDVLSLRQGAEVLPDSKTAEVAPLLHVRVDCPFLRLALLKGRFI